MAELKNKVVTVESLAALHTHNQEAYMSQIDPAGSGTFIMDGAINANSLKIGNAVLEYNTSDGVLKIVFE